MAIRNVIRGIVFSILVLAVFGVIDDFLFTLAADLTENIDLQFAIRAGVIAFSTAFVGAYVVRRRVDLIAVILVTVYWIVVAVYRYSTGFSAAEIGFFQFVSDGLRTIVPSIAFCWLGAFLGWKYSVGADKPKTSLMRRSRTTILAIIFLVFFAVAPTAYSFYWQSQAVDQVRIAVRAIQLGKVPDNVLPFKDDLYDSTPNVQSLIQELTPETQFLADYKIGERYHGYQVEIRPESGTKYSASATYYGDSDWRISCCFKHD